MVTGYGLSFWMLALVVRTIPVGIAYAIWAGLGIVLVSIAAAILYRQHLDLPAVLGMALIMPAWWSSSCSPAAPATKLLADCSYTARPFPPDEVCTCPNPSAPTS